MSDSSDARDDHIQSLVGRAADEYTDRLNRGESVEIDEYAERYPEIADVLRQVLPTIGCMCERGSGAARSVGPRLSVAGVPECLGDYRILREVGRGGMGVVYEAEQASLGRRVALKVLPLPRLLDRMYLARFEREAQAAARLHHTNIVPVFGVGESEGIHFYVMQFIAGHGLDRVLEVLRLGRQRADRTDDQAETVIDPHSPGGSALRVAQGLCAGHTGDRVGHQARREGSASSSEGQGDGAAINTRSDQTFSRYARSVARIGLQVADALSHAHSQGILHRDIKPSNLLVDDAGVVWVTDFGLAKADDTENLTQTGDLVGTLRYAAPERLAGLADERSDIFSLGLTLYELLTLRPAYAGKTQDMLVQQVSTAEPVSPRKTEPRIPRDLTTIIEKAIAKDPARRYSTASQLAADLQRFLEDRPIRARRVGHAEQVWRWCRRNPLVAGLGAGFLVALMGGVSAVVWQWQLAERQRHRAEANFQKAREAVDDCFTTVTTNPVLQEPGMEGARQVLFQAALKYYQDFLDQGAGDSQAQEDLARAYSRLAYITERIGSKVEALAAYERACELFGKQAAAEPTKPHLRVELARCYQCLGNLHRLAGRTGDAEASLLKALELRADLARTDPAVSDYQIDLADAQQALGTLYRSTGRPVDAEAAYLRAQALRQRVVRDAPTRADYRNALGRGFSELAHLYTVAGRVGDAESALGKALATMEELTRDYPDVADYRDQLATCYNSLGSHFLNSSRGEFNRIEALYQQALSIREQLVRDHPRVQKYQSDLARTWNNLGLWYYMANKDAKAAAHYAKALALREQLARKHPSVVAYRKEVAKTHNDLGLLFHRVGRWHDAERSFRQALSLQEGLREQNPEVGDFAIELATTANNLGLLARHHGRPRESIDWFTRAVQPLNSVLKAEPQQTDARKFLAEAYGGRARSLTNLELHSEALADWDRSLEWVKKSSSPSTRLGRAATLAHLGRYREALEEVEQLTSHNRESQISLVDAARVFAAAARPVSADPTLEPEERHSRAEALAERAMDFLTRGCRSGEIGPRSDIVPLRIDLDFEILRSRADFRALLQKLEATHRDSVL